MKHPTVPTPKSLRSGDHRAFDRLYDEFAPRVRGYLLRLTNGSRAEAEDLTQETFLAAFQGRDTFRGTAAAAATPVAWLLGIARRRWRDGQRGAAAADTAPLDDDTIATVNDGDPSDRIATALTLEDALARLPTAERDCLLLTAVQGLTYAEAARVLEEPVGTVKWRVHRATRALRQILNAAEERYEATAADPDRQHRQNARSPDAPRRAGDESVGGMAAAPPHRP